MQRGGDTTANIVRQRCYFSTTNQWRLEEIKHAGPGRRTVEDGAGGANSNNAVSASEIRRYRVSMPARPFDLRQGPGLTAADKPPASRRATREVRLYGVACSQNADIERYKTAMRLFGPRARPAVKPTPTDRDHKRQGQRLNNRVEEFEQVSMRGPQEDDSGIKGRRR